ncbi:cell wall protein Ecm33 [Didymella glomerata]|uniref:Cell wall protein Ecm33 n=1 Tax=Didymella glomerata TaxID=749621 RepID=A0A9W8WYK1_9PLEO|nr:cell wall protein Ecm33 [Didymella glomerata]
MASSFAVFLGCSGDLAINSADDITKLNGCTTFDGNVSLAAKGIQDITLNGLKAVTGTISIADSDAVLSISSTTLESISALILNNLPNLTTLALPALSNFSKLGFEGLFSLKECAIATGGVKQDVKEISIINTALQKMDWIKWPVAATLTIAANNNLTEFTLPYDKISSGSSYQFSINQALNNLDFSNLSGIYGSLAVNGNNDPSLSFDKLETIDGYVKINGIFENITMPNLQAINGALNVESFVTHGSGILTFCNWLGAQPRLSGHYDCTANNTLGYTPNSATLSNSPSGTAGASPSSNTTIVKAGDTTDAKKSDLSTGAIIGIAIAMVFLISIVLTASALLFFRRRARNEAKRAAAAATLVPDEKKTHSTSTIGEELDASGIRYELGESYRVQELPGAQAVGELDGQTLQELDVEKPYFRDQKPAPESPMGRFELP